MAKKKNYELRIKRKHLKINKMKKFPELKTAKYLSDNEMSIIRGGSCDSCTNGCKEACKSSCQPSNKNQGNGNTIVIGGQSTTSKETQKQ
jgi:natural product precursor